MDVIANSATNGSAERIAVPATLRKLPNFVSQLRGFILVWSFWLGLLAHNKVAKFGMTDMTERNLIGIYLLK
jgi:hypothetical protein